jgi:hypothetical protein
MIILIENYNKKKFEFLVVKADDQITSDISLRIFHHPFVCFVEIKSILEEIIN